MTSKIRIGLLGLGTVGTGVVKIVLSPEGRHPLVSEVSLKKIAVKDLKRSRDKEIPSHLLTDDPMNVVEDPDIDLVVEVIGGIEPARTLILKAISLGKSVVTANKAVIARYGDEIANAAKANNVYVLIEGAVGGGIPIVEPLKQSLGGNKLKKISGIINGTTNYILSRMSLEGANFDDVLEEAQKLGFAESDPTADVDGLDAADKLSILSGLAFGGTIERSLVPTKGIRNLQSSDIEYANELGYDIKLLAIAESLSDKSNKETQLALRVEPTLIEKNHPLAKVSGVNNAILVEGSPIGEVMFYGPGAGAGPTASAVVADILNIASERITREGKNCLNPLLSASQWSKCVLVKPSEIIQKNYLRLITNDSPGVIGKIGKIFGENNVSIKSIVQFDSSESVAEIVVITHKGIQGQMMRSIEEIKNLSVVIKIASHLGCL